MVADELLFATANKLYRRGDFSGALALYKNAANVYGPSMVKANVVACQRRLKAEQERADA